MAQFLSLVVGAAAVVMLAIAFGLAQSQKDTERDTARIFVSIGGIAATAAVGLFVAGGTS